MHWADVLAKELQARGSHHVLATGITPSGPIHIGNMREVLTTEAVHRAVQRAGGESDLVYVGDTYDPLRKVYPFLDESVYASEVGKPLSEIPCPDGRHESYAHHFLEPFLKDLEQLGIRPRVVLAHELYARGAYLEATKEALENADLIRGILERVAGRKLEPSWLPFNVQCESCRRLKGPVADLYEYPYIEYHCEACGHGDGRKDVRVPGGGKLPWRIDWPARWRFLEVTFEAMGKDHAAAGSSWDTGIEISEKAFRYPPPLRTVYEFILLKGVGAMHSSTGTAVSASDMIRMAPPEVLRFLIVRSQPSKHIDFDPGLGLIDLVNEYDRWEEAFFSKDAAVRSKPDLEELDRVYELSQPSALPDELPPKVPYNHLVLLAQLSSTWEGVLDVLKRSEIVPQKLSPEEERHLRHRVEHARFWLEKFAPAEARTEVQRRFDAALTKDLEPGQRAFLWELGSHLSNARWTGDAIHNAIHETAKHRSLQGGKAFEAVYAAFLGQRRGPRAGYLLASLDKGFVLQRLREAGNGNGPPVHG